MKQSTYNKLVEQISKDLLLDKTGNISPLGCFILLVLGISLAHVVVDTYIKNNFNVVAGIAYYKGDSES